MFGRLNKLEDFLEVKVLLALFLCIVFSSGVFGVVSGVDNVSFNSNSDFFNGSVFVVDFTESGQTDGIDVFLESESMGSAVEDRVVEQDVEVDVSPSFTSAVYGFRDTGKMPIRSVESTSFFVDTYADQDRGEIVSLLNDSALVESRCLDLNGDGAVTVDSDFVFRSDVFRDWNFETRVYCFSEGQRLASVGEIGSDTSAVFSTEFSVSNGDRTVRKNITNNDVGDGSSSMIGDDVRVHWMGNMGTGRNAPVPSDELISHSNSEGWKVIDRDNYDNYVEEVRNGRSRLEDWRDGLSSGERVEASIDVAADVAYQNHSSSEFTEGSFIGSSIEEGKLSLQIDDLRYPRFSIYLKACEAGNDCDAFIQVSKPSGEPVITDFSKTIVPELGVGKINVEIKNVGEFEGSFSSRISSCTDGFSFVGVSDTVRLKPNESSSATFKTGFSSVSEAKNVSGSCVVEVKDQNSDTVFSENVSLMGVQQNECEANQRFVVDKNGRDQIRECSGSGMSSKLVDTCNSEERAEIQFGEFKCVEENGNSNTRPRETSSILDLLSKLSNIVVSNGISSGEKTMTFIEQVLAILDAVDGFLTQMSDILNNFNLNDILKNLLIGTFVAGSLYLGLNHWRKGRG